MKSLKAILLAAGLTWLFVTPALASGIYDFTQALVTTDPTPLSLGFLFSTNSSVTVTSLGYFDAGQDGFAVAHTVGIYDDCGNLVTSITLDAGTGDTLDGDFRYHSITPVVLAAGKTYTLAATTGGDADGFAYGIAGKKLQGLDVNPLITIASDASLFVYQSDDELQDPTGHYRYTLYAGPNFGISPGTGNSGAAAAVPESGSLVLTLAGAALIVIGKFRKRRA